MAVKTVTTTEYIYGGLGGTEKVGERVTTVTDDTYQVDSDRGFRPNPAMVDGRPGAADPTTGCDENPEKEPANYFDVSFATLEKIAKAWETFETWTKVGKR